METSRYYCSDSFAWKKAESQLICGPHTSCTIIINNLSFACQLTIAHITLTTLQGTLLLSRHDIPYKILPRSGMLPKIPIRGSHPTTWRSGISHLLKFAVTWSHHLLHLSCRSLWLQVSELRQWTLKPIQTWRQFLLFPIVPRTSNQFVLAHTHGGRTKSAWGSCRRPTSPNGSLSKCANSERKWRRVHCGP